MNDFGTLGTILTDDEGKYYAITCAHVAAQHDLINQPARRDRRGATIIGKSILSTALLPCSSTTACNPWSAIASNELDLSLIELDTGGARLEVLRIGRLSGVAPRASLTTGQVVEVMGRTSGYNMLQIGGLAVWYRFSDAGIYYCFRNLFEVEWPYGCTRAIRQGDSGAPVCTPGRGGPDWCGMIVGCDGFKGFAIYSEPAMAWLVDRGYNLRLAENEPEAKTPVAADSDVSSHDQTAACPLPPPPPDMRLTRDLPVGPPLKLKCDPLSGL